MKKNVCLAALFCLAFSLTISAQKISKPTLVPTEATAAQKLLINEGIKLHDQKRYDEAIKIYQRVLKENSNNDQALYEMAFSFYNKKDLRSAVETAYQLIQYKSSMGFLGYGLIASALDDLGKPKEAVEIYQKAIKQLESDAEFQSNVSNLYYNLGITYFRQKQFKEAREASKKAVELEL